MPEPRSIYPKHFLQEHFPQEAHPDRKTGFILIPFKDEFKPVEEAIRKAIARANLKPQRADDLDLFNPRATMESILQGIAHAQVVVADMTGKNENVFYETGIAHTIKENVVLLTQATGKLPFDSQHIPHLPYSTDDLDKLTEDLYTIISGLQPEPPPERLGAAYPESPTGAKNDLRRRLDACEREWTNQVVPTEAKRFYERFPALHTSPSISMSDDDWEESLRVHLPAFLPPWQRVEDLGLHVIRESPAFDSVIPELILALERAYTLSDRIRPQQPNTITGHSALLALRTWTLWGAVALDCENWTAVKTLLHRPTNIEPNYPPLTKLHLHYPAATGNRIDLAARSVEDQLTPLAAQQFGDVESMRAFVGFWQFTVDFATQGADECLLQVWATAPRNRFEGLVAQLGTDRDFASHFAEAVSQTGLATLGQEWREGLRDRLLDRRKLGIERHHGDLPRLPDSLAGVGPRRSPRFMSPPRP